MPAGQEAVNRGRKTPSGRPPLYRVTPRGGFPLEAAEIKQPKKQIFIKAARP